MFFVPASLSNALLLITCFLAGFQHMKMKRLNPITNLQFFMMCFCLAMIVIVAAYNRVSPWLSLGFFLIAVGSLALMIREHRMLPPSQPFS